MGLRKINRKIDLAYHSVKVQWLQVYYAQKLLKEKTSLSYFILLKLTILKAFFSILLFFRFRKTAVIKATSHKADTPVIVNQPTVTIIILSKDKKDTIACSNGIMKSTMKVPVIVFGMSLNEPFSIEGADFVNGKQNWSEKLSNVLGTISTEFVCFVNDEICVGENWINDLFTIFDHYPAVAACPKVKYDFGLLHNAGIDFELGEPLNRGQFEDPDHLPYNYITTVAGSNHCLLVKRKDFPTGLPNHIPTFLFDLSQKIVLKSNGKIYYQCLAETAIHSFKNTTFNQKQFSNSNNLAAKPTPMKSILIIDAVLPTPDQDSGSRRLFEIIRLFKKMGLDVYFFNHLGLRKYPYYQNLVNLGIKVFFSAVEKPGFHVALKEVAKHITYMWISRPDMNEIYGSKIKTINPKIKWIYDTVDLHYLRLQRAYELQSALNVKTEETIQSIKQKELLLAEKADLTLTVTEVEKIILESNGIKNVAVIPNIHVLNKENFANDNFNDRSGIIFIGSYDHEPNIDAVKWLVHDIMPLVWANPAGKDIKVALLGSRPTAEVLALQSEKVEVTGFIHDVSPFFLKAKVFVAPLRFGAGMKGKIGQSLEFGLPIVSTSIGTEGMGLKDEEHILLADDKIKFAEQLLRLYHQQELWELVRRNSFSSLTNYLPETVEKNLIKILKALD